MPKLVIEGAKQLNGEIKIQGSKNSVLPILAATIICDDECIINNCPDLLDVYTSIEILKYLGCKIKFENSTLTVDPRSINRSDIPEYLMRKMRSSIIFLGALLSKSGNAKLSLPGGCELGPRPIDLHLDGLRQMGFIIYENHGYIECMSKYKLPGCNITLSFPSVGATENLILASVKSSGVTVINNVAREPEICDLINFLNKCGAKIKGAGESTLLIEGVESLHSAQHSIIPDRIVATTYMSAAAITGGTLLLKNVSVKELDSVIPIFEEAGCLINKKSESQLYIEAPSRLYPNKLIRTMPYPGFPTDSQPLIMAMASVANGTSVFVENIFENRYKHVGELLRLGADIKIEGKVAIVEGVKRLSGANVTSTDLRGAAALVISGLAAEGITTISDVHHIDRGYESIEKNLKSLGANIERKN